MSECYNGKGVIPDYICEQTIQSDDLNNDNQFLQAYALVMN